MKNYVEFKTADGAKVIFRVDQICAFEVVPASARAEAGVKLYVPGYHFVVREKLEDVLAKLGVQVDG